jgi:NitT/TauT family transport system ATP-binding protein
VQANPGTGIDVTAQRAVLQSVPPRAAVPPKTHITIRGLSKSFGGASLYKDFDLDLPRGKVITFFGPNGCGKSTLINLICGLIRPDAGEVLFDGKTLRETVIGYVFQNYRDALFPWLSARDNILYPLKIARWSKAQSEQRIEELVAEFGVAFDLRRYPYEFSGGQQQLISIMRALAPRPEVVFLDEPFSALDFEATLSIRDKLQEVFQKEAVTTVVVSHDLEEAVYLADYVYLLTKRPTRVAEIVPFEEPRPRTAAMLSDAAFINTKRRCLEIFQREVRK